MVGSDTLALAGAALAVGEATGVTNITGGSGGDGGGSPSLGGANIDLSGLIGDLPVGEAGGNVPGGIIQSLQGALTSQGIQSQLGELQEEIGGAVGGKQPAPFGPQFAGQFGKPGQVLVGPDGGLIPIGPNGNLLPGGLEAGEGIGVDIPGRDTSPFGGGGGGSGEERTGKNETPSFFEGVTGMQAPRPADYLVNQADTALGGIMSFSRESGRKTGRAGATVVDRITGPPGQLESAIRDTPEQAVDAIVPDNLVAPISTANAGVSGEDETTGTFSGFLEQANAPVGATETAVKNLLEMSPEELPNGDGPDGSTTAVAQSEEFIGNYGSVTRTRGGDPLAGAGDPRGGKSEEQSREENENRATGGSLSDRVSGDPIPGVPGL